MTIRLYRADDAGAPVLSGTAGSLIAVLDACLVNGYGSKPAAGWGKPFSGTHLAAYRAPVGNRLYLQVDDTSAQYPRLRGYEAMTAIDAGSGPFPTDTLLSGGGYAAKSSTASTVARPWLLVADAQAFYLYVSTDTTALATPNYVATLFFGDLIAYKPADPWATALICRHGSGTSASSENFGRLAQSAAVTAGHYLARNSAGVAGAVGCNAQTHIGIIVCCGAGGSPYPDPVTDRLNLARIPLAESNFALRGHLPGVANPLHLTPGAQLDTVTGIDGETWLLLRIYPGATGCIALKITGDWRTGEGA